MLKKLICFILVAFMTILVVSCEPPKDGETFDKKGTQTTEEAAKTSDNTSSEDETTNTTEPIDEDTNTDDTTGSGDPDDWTGIY